MKDIGLPCSSTSLPPATRALPPSASTGKGGSRMRLALLTAMPLLEALGSIASGKSRSMAHLPFVEFGGRPTVPWRPFSLFALTRPCNITRSPTLNVAISLLMINYMNNAHTMHAPNYLVLSLLCLAKIEGCAGVGGGGRFVLSSMRCMHHKNICWVLRVRLTWIFCVLASQRGGNLVEVG